MIRFAPIQGLCRRGTAALAMTLLPMLALALSRPAAAAGDRNSSAAASAQRIVQKMTSAVSGHRSYDATLCVTVYKGDGVHFPPRTSTVIRARGVTAGPGAPKLALSLTPWEEKDPNAALLPPLPEVKVYQDVATDATFFPGQNRFARTATVPASGLLPLLRHMLNAADSGLTYRLASDRYFAVGGREAYPIVATPTATSTVEIPDRELFLAVDKQTFEPLLLISTRRGKEANGKPVEVKCQITVAKLSFDTPFSDSDFQFTPPAGAVETPTVSEVGSGSLLNFLGMFRF